MSELIPKIARITRLLPQEGSRIDRAYVPNGSKETLVAVTQPLSFPLYTKIPATDERVNWSVKTGFPSKYFSSLPVTFDNESSNRNKHTVSLVAGHTLAKVDQFDFSRSAPAKNTSQQAINILKSKQFFEEN